MRVILVGRLVFTQSGECEGYKILRLRLRTLRGFLPELVLSFVEGVEMTTTPNLASLRPFDFTQDMLGGRYSPNWHSEEVS